jgi:heme-degrading monooxygenase HmoA
MITEIIQYKLKEGADEEKFMTEAIRYHAYFKATFNGFIDLEFTKGEDGWINIMHWESMEDVKACGEVLKTSPQETAGYAALTDRTSLKLTFLEQKLRIR